MSKHLLCPQKPGPASVLLCGRDLSPLEPNLSLPWTGFRQVRPLNFLSIFTASEWKSSDFNCSLAHLICDYNIHLFLIELHILIGRLISKHTFLNSRTENQDNASIPEFFFVLYWSLKCFLNKVVVVILLYISYTLSSV